MEKLTDLQVRPFEALREPQPSRRKGPRLFWAIHCLFPKHATSRATPGIIWDRQPPQPNLKMGSDKKHKSSSSRHQHDGTKHDTNVHIGHSKPKDKKKSSSSDNVRWICSYCNAGNLSYNYDASCPFCFTARGSGVSTYTP
ncbi:uncharacterized protein PG986_010807 [Apiospora aurea]|uniref:RanBP2-type domain-containing protein n=1 Tax=Apiospora aurea TaxID=335848 RepID=A0ABR1Q3A6_9PEZI